MSPLRQFHTAVLERNQVYTDDFDTEPYECAWAGEALWFVRVQELGGDGVALDVRAQISPDGLIWCDEGAQLPPLREPGLYMLKVREFGGWLRLACRMSGVVPRVKVLIYLSLKS